MQHLTSTLIWRWFDSLTGALKTGWRSYHSIEVAAIGWIFSFLDLNNRFNFNRDLIGR